MIRDLGIVHVGAQLFQIQTDLLGHCHDAYFLGTPSHTRHFQMELRVFVLRPRCQCRARREHRSFTQDRPFAKDHADIAVGRNQGFDFGRDLLARCMIPRFDGLIFSLEWKEALWDKFVMAAPRPRTPSEQQYSDRKL